MENKYLDKSGVLTLRDMFFQKLAQLVHQHNVADITDFPDIPDKLSDLPNDVGYITKDENTTYTLTKAENTITLTGSDGSQYSIIDDDTKIAVDNELSSTSNNPVQNKVINTELNVIKGTLDTQANLIASKIDNNALNNYYTKTEVDNLELITVEDIDIICGTTIQIASADEVEF